MGTQIFDIGKKEYVDFVTELRALTVKNSVSYRENRISESVYSLNLDLLFDSIMALQSLTFDENDWLLFAIMAEMLSPYDNAVDAGDLYDRLENVYLDELGDEEYGE